jgi:hypothetical protein
MIVPILANPIIFQLTLLQNSGKGLCEIVHFGFSNSALAYETVQCKGNKEST